MTFIQAKMCVRFAVARGGLLVFASGAGHVVTPP